MKTIPFPSLNARSLSRWSLGTYLLSMFLPLGISEGSRFFPSQPISGFELALSCLMGSSLSPGKLQLISFSGVFANVLFLLSVVLFFRRRQSPWSPYLGICVLDTVAVVLTAPPLLTFAGKFFDTRLPILFFLGVLFWVASPILLLTAAFRAHSELNF
jgi:hypothetical protein